MDLLLDTHAFIWWRNDDPRLGAVARGMIEDPVNRVMVSAACVWEIATKRRLKKLVFTGSPSAAIVENGFVEMPISPADAEAAGDMDWAHKDPFDRLLVAQARRLGATLVTSDALIGLGWVPVLWAG